MDYADMPEELLLGETANYLNFICTDAKGLRQMNKFYQRMFLTPRIRIPQREGSRNDFRRQLMNRAFRLAIFINNTDNVHCLLPSLLEEDGVAHKDDPRAPVVLVLALGFLYSNPERPFGILRLFQEFCQKMNIAPTPMGSQWVIRMVMGTHFRADLSYHPVPVDKMKPTTKQWLANHLRPDDLPNLLKGYTTVAQQLDFLDFALGCDHLIEAAMAGGQLWLKGINTLRQEIEMGCLLEGKEAPDNQLLTMYKQQQCLSAKLEETARQLKARQRQIDQDKQKISQLAAQVEGYEKSINDFYESFKGWKSPLWQHGDSHPELPPSEKLGHLLPGLNEMVELADSLHPYLEGNCRIPTEEIVNYCLTNKVDAWEVNAVVCMLRYFVCKIPVMEDRLKLHNQCERLQKLITREPQPYPTLGQQPTQATPFIVQNIQTENMQAVNKGGKGAQLNFDTASARPADTHRQGKKKKRSHRNGPSDSQQQGTIRGKTNRRRED